MNIAVFSDSHGQTNRMVKFLLSRPSVNYIIHLGDLVQDARYIGSMFPQIPLAGVCGNGDFSDSRSDFEKKIEIGGKKFFLCHGHTKSVQNSLDRLFKLTLSREPYDVILFGHTHRAYETIYNGALILNPGSVTLPRDGTRPSCALLSINASGQISADILRL